MSIDVQAMLDETVAAVRASSNGGAKSVTISNRTWTGLDLPEPWAQLDKLKAELTSANSRSRMRTGVATFRMPGRSVGLGRVIDRALAQLTPRWMLDANLQRQFPDLPP